MNITALKLGAAGAALLLFAACGDSNEPTSSVTNSASTALTGYFADIPAEGAIGVAAARSSARPGDVITVRGVIGGTVTPFTDGYAMFVLSDESIAFCSTDDEHCAQPWDACCEDPDKLAAGRALVQLVHENGAPIPLTIRGVNGLTELDSVLVTGQVAPASSPQNLILNATAIQRVQ